jgi:phosphoglycerate dehydrogenase-like enzyme
MKFSLRNAEKFNPGTVAFYQEHFELVEEKDADVIVINDFEPITTDKIVACNSTGLDHIKAPEVISLRGEDLTDLTAVPELCLGMAILLTRELKREEIRGKTLGLIGYGRIAKKFERYAVEMGMNVVVCEKGDPKVLLEMSDIVSLHITADEDNRNFFDWEKFKFMKDGSILLNSARPWLVERDALKWALDHKLAGAWFDFDMPGSEHIEHDNFVTTDHLGGTTKESRAKSELIIANKLLKRYGNRTTKD